MERTELLRLALIGAIAERAQINERIADVKSQLGIGAPVAAETSPSAAKVATLPTSGRRPMSDDARKRIAKAQKKRWAKFHQEQALKAAS